MEKGRGGGVEGGIKKMGRGLDMAAGGQGDLETGEVGDEEKRGELERGKLKVSLDGDVFINIKKDFLL